MQTLRTEIADAKRIVVKVGSRALVQRTGRPDLPRLRELVRQLAALQKSGREIVLVSSGAIAAGMEALGLTKRPTLVPDLQMAAAVGQSRLMATYDKLFTAKGCRIGQVLLTHDDLKHRTRHVNARNTMSNLLAHGIIPVVNENDVVAVDEIKFGDNDLLASLVTMLIEADLLILLTTVDGVRAPSGRGTKRVAVIDGISDQVLALASGKGSELSTGGMLSKLQSAGMVVASGIPVVIANGRTDGILEAVMTGADKGTLIRPGTKTPAALQSLRKRWIAFFHKTQGTIVVDDGARDALVKKGRSLLPIGVKAVEGDFDESAVVNVRSLDGTIIARGQTDFSSRDLRRIQGHRSEDVASILGPCDTDVVIHRDNLVLLNNS